MVVGSPELVLAKIRELDDYLLVAHIHPDGDSIGSLLGLADLLEQLGKRWIIASAEEVPSSYRFLPGSEEIRVGTEGLSGSFRNVIALDVSEALRLGDLQPVLAEAQVVINIDHHQGNSFPEPKYVRTSACATGELIYELFLAAGLKPTVVGAKALYTAIMTDTGRFSHANTTQTALKIAAELVGLGADPHHQYVEVYERKDIRLLKLLAKVLDSLRLVCDGKVAYLVIDQETLAGFPLDMGDTENYISYAQMIDGVQIALLFREVEGGTTKVSWRSVPGVDVSRYARDFGGGGHVNAAGCEIAAKPQEAVQKVLEYLQSRIC